MGQSRESVAVPEDRPEGRVARKCSRTNKMNGGCLIAILTLSFTLNCVRSHLPEKYPIEVYHMLQERTQYGIGSENRVKGTWGPWSAWTECSRSCGTGVQSQARECVLSRGSRRKRGVPVEYGNSTIEPKPICIGTYRRYHICNTQDCNDFPDDPRTEQCAKYNNKIYKGQSYIWVPFLNAANPCALNCRAVGQRFYATLEPAVVDGTPCDGPNVRGRSTGMSIDKTEQWLCVAGQCRPVGCDGVIGSGATRDTCGICGGVGKGCKLYEGIFMEPIMLKGHQPVTIIPKGAMSLNISELRSSANFLALKTENGSYILNSPWSVSPSGTYKAAGTSITYQRGDRARMESILAAGPLNESLKLEISYHELNPGVLYKYTLPLTEPDDGAMIAPPLRAIGSNDRGNEIPESDTRLIPASDPTRMDKNPESLPEKRSGSETRQTDRKKEDMKYSPTTVMAGDAPKIISHHKKRGKKGKKKFSWKIDGFTPCSKTCGGGLQTAVLKCIRNIKGSQANERRCRNLEKPRMPPPLRCNDRPCPARWKADPWSECSVTCGTGTRTRKLECVQELNAKLTMRVAAGACVQPPDLRTVESCSRPVCSNISLPEVRTIQTGREVPRWNSGPWTSCSSSCGRGIKKRMVTCITSGTPCSPVDKPESEKVCEIRSCNSKYETDNAVWMYSEWHSGCSRKCGSGFDTREIVCSHSNEDFCESKRRPEVKRSCVSNETFCHSAAWFTGPWSPCTVTCGTGEQSRDVICVKKIEEESRIVSNRDCPLDIPESRRKCQMPDCLGQWYTSDWSECSQKCGEGIKKRTVRCLLEKTEVGTCSPESKPQETHKCNLGSCKIKSYHLPSRIAKKVPETGRCVDDYPNCALVVKTGLCRIKYYKHSCCDCRD